MTSSSSSAHSTAASNFFQLVRSSLSSPVLAVAVVVDAIRGFLVPHCAAWTCLFLRRANSIPHPSQLSPSSNIFFGFLLSTCSSVRPYFSLYVLPFIPLAGGAFAFLTAAQTTAISSTVGSGGGASSSSSSSSFSSSLLDSDSLVGFSVR